MEDFGSESLASCRIAGTNLMPFVRHWLIDLGREKGLEVSLLSRYGSDYAIGAQLLMSHIAPVATRREAARDVLLLFAVLATFQSAGFPGRDEWTTPRDHVCAAFAYAQDVGERQMAHRLLMFVASEQQYHRQPEVIEFKRKITQGDADRLARHEAKIEATLDRSVRAARLLDPGVSQARARAAIAWNANWTVTARNMRS